MLRFIFLLCFSTCTFALLAQCNLSLKIQSSEDQKPVSANITADGVPLTGSGPIHSFSAGFFCGRSYNLTITAAGYMTKETRFQINKDTQINISLQPSISLPDVEILANRMPGNILPAVTSISGSLAERCQHR